MSEVKEIVSVPKIVGLSYADKLREKLMKKYSIKLSYQSSSVGNNIFKNNEPFIESLHAKISTAECALTKLYMIFRNRKTIICSGSTAEGHGAANHFRQDRKLQDIDYMIEIGCLYSDEQLLPVRNAPGFVMVKWAADDETEYLPHDDGFVNGFQIKKVYAEFIRDQGQLLGGKSDTKPESASVQCTINLDLSHVFPSFHDALKYIETIEQNEIKRRNFLEYCRCLEDYMKTECSKLAGMHISTIADGQFYQDILSLLSPAFGFQLSNSHRAKTEQILDFYFKYRPHMNSITLNPLFSQQAQSGLSSVEMDLVPSLKLEFWPSDMQWFLNRLKTNRSLLFQKIEPIHMHIVPKWSRQTIDNETCKTLEFRYSFSLIEIKLSEERSPIEQILNRVARGLFYKYIHKSSAITSSPSSEQYLPSYFVKTIVLWMCETIDLDKIYTALIIDESREEKLLASRLAKRWIEYVCSILKSRICPHYFIKNLNILDGYSEQYLNELAFILQNNIDLNDEYVPCAQLHTADHTEKMEQHMNEEEKTTIELLDQPDFIQDCLTLCADMPLDENCIKMLVNDDDDSDDTNGDDDSDDTNDDDDSIIISAIFQGFILLNMMALFDDSSVNNWRLWKKLFISDVSNRSPILHANRKFTKETVLYHAQTMMVALNAKPVDIILGHKEFDIVLRSAFSSPLLNFDNFLNTTVTRNLPIFSQQAMGEIYSRSVTQDPSENITQFVDIIQNLLTTISGLFRSNHMRLGDVLPAETMNTTSHTDFMKGQSAIKEESTSETQMSGKQRVQLESIPDIELD